ncbi:MAG: hypothetical protein K6T31_04230, partial [Alicyclobacillus sp.]|nr:hypothetical protein [Alicyclobacillus sp.]
VDVDETIMGATGVGAPVFNANGDVVAAVGAMGPNVQLQGKALQLAMDQVKQAAEQISARMGYTSAPVAQEQGAAWPTPASGA